MADDRHPDPDQPDDLPSGETGGAPEPGPTEPAPRPQNRPLGGNPPLSGNAGSEGVGGSGTGGPGNRPLGGTPGAGASGNPFEALFGSFGMPGIPGGAPGAAGFNPANLDLNALMGQLQSAFAAFGAPGGMFSAAGGDGGVNWDVTKDTARKTAASLGPDPTPTMAQQRSLGEAAALAEVWLDQATGFPRVSSSVSAWSRAEWIERTLPVWRRLVEPVASRIAEAMEGALTLGGPEAQGVPELAGLEQMLRPMLRTSGASMFGLQLGQGLGKLAGEVVGATDIGLPLSQPGRVALLPTNVAAFAAGLEQSESDVSLYLALRECARQRLFVAVPWLREQMLALVESYARGITIDTTALEEAVGQMDPNNLADLGQVLEGNLFEPRKTPEQQATLERLETMLALVEGWVDEVVGQATAGRMPAAVPLAETVRRARATGGPAEATFATLVGLELRPRRMRDAANLWAALREARGPDGRDAVWAHPDVLPAAADLDDPLGFVSGDRAATPEADEFDTALAELLEAEQGKDEPDPGTASDPGHDPR